MEDDVEYGGPTLFYRVEPSGDGWGIWCGDRQVLGSDFRAPLLFSTMELANAVADALEWETRPGLNVCALAAASTLADVKRRGVLPALSEAAGAVLRNHFVLGMYAPSTGRLAVGEFENYAVELLPELVKRHRAIA